jgi:hypothetical protein
MLVGSISFCAVVLLSSGFCWVLEHGLDKNERADLRKVQARAQHAIQQLQPTELFNLVYGGYSLEQIPFGGPREVHEATYHACIAQENTARNKDYCTKDVVPMLNRIPLTFRTTPERVAPVSTNQSHLPSSRQALYESCLFTNHSGEYLGCLTPPTSPPSPSIECPLGIRCATDILPNAFLAREKCQSDIKNHDKTCVFLSTRAAFDQWCNEAIDQFCKTLAIHSAAQKRSISSVPLGAIIAAFIWEGGHLKWLESAVLLLQLFLGAAITIYITKWLRGSGRLSIYGLVWLIVFGLPLGSLVFGCLTAIPVLWVAKLALYLFGKSLTLMATAAQYLTPAAAAGYITLHATEHKFTNFIEHIFSFFTESFFRQR